MATARARTLEQIKGIKDAVERRKAVQAWVDDQQAKRRAAERREAAEAERRARVDSGKSPDVSPPAGRTIQTWKRRKPIVRGGAVTGRRTGGTTA